MSKVKPNPVLIAAVLLFMTATAGAQYDPMVIDIDEAYEAAPGDTVMIAINKTDGATYFDSFDMLIAYDSDQLNPLYAIEGDLIDSGVFQYFDYRAGSIGDPSDNLYAVRLIGMQNDGVSPPNPLPPINGNGELARIYFEVTETAECANCLLQFLWNDCGDNVIGVPDLPPGDSVPGYLVSTSVYDFAGVTLTDSTASLPSYGGCTDSCYFDTPIGPVWRYIEYFGGKIETAGCTNPDDRGDLNLNGIPYEVADALIYETYFMIGLGAFTIDMEAQIATTDINGDGINLTMHDYIYLIRVIEGELPPLYRMDIDDITGNIFITDTDTSLIVSTDFDGWVGGFLINFSLNGVSSYNIDLLDGADHLNLNLNDENLTLKMLLSQIRSSGEDDLSAVIDSGLQNVMEIFYENSAPNLLSVTPVGFLGENVNYTVHYTTPDNAPPVFDAYPSVLYNDSAGVFFYDFNAPDPEGDPVSYYILSGVGNIETNTGVYSFGPVCCEMDSVLQVTICAEDMLHPCPQDNPDYHATFSLVVSDTVPLLGDFNNNNTINIIDILGLIEYKFNNGPPPIPLENGDANRDGAINIIDILFLIEYKFNQGSPPTCQ